MGDQHQQEIADLLQHIAATGPVRVADFASDRHTKTRLVGVESRTSDIWRTCLAPVS